MILISYKRGFIVFEHLRFQCPKIAKTFLKELRKSGAENIRIRVR